MKRFGDWEYRLGCFLEEIKNRGRSLSYPHTNENDWDCGKFVCEAILRMTGRPVSVWVDCYSDWRVLAQLMGNAHAFDNYVLSRMIDADIPKISVEEMRKGDVAVLKMPNDRRGIGLSLGATIAAPDENGLAYVDRSLAVTAYQVG